MTSVIGGPTKGDSNSLEGGFEAEERRLDGALFSDAPTEIRTPVSSLKGWRPSPLDDGGIYNGWDSITPPIGGQASRRQMLTSALKAGWSCFD